MIIKDLISIKDPGFFTIADFKKNLDYKPDANIKQKILDIVAKSENSYDPSINNIEFSKNEEWEKELKNEV